MMISDARQRELIQYALASEPMTDAEVRRLIIEARAKAGKPPLTEEALVREARAVNRGNCKMNKTVDPEFLKRTPVERVELERERSAKRPQTREEAMFVETIRADQMADKEDVSPAAVVREEFAKRDDISVQSTKGEVKAAEPFTIEEHLLLKIAMGCPELDKGLRKLPNHWQVFRAAWKDGQSGNEMQRRHKWSRRTVDKRLRAVEEKYLGGVKVSSLRYDPAILRNVEAQLKAAHKHNVNLRPQDLL